MLRTRPLPVSVAWRTAPVLFAYELALRRARRAGLVGRAAWKPPARRCASAIVQVRLARRSALSSWIHGRENQRKPLRDAPSPMAGRSSCRSTRAATSPRAPCGTSWRSSAWTPKNSGSCSKPEARPSVQDSCAVCSGASTGEHRAGHVKRRLQAGFLVRRSSRWPPPRTGCHARPP